MSELAVVVPVSVPAEQNPAVVYLAGMSPGSRPSMKQALNTLAALLTSGRCSAESLPWWQLGYQHTTAVRSALLEKYKAPATVNRHLAALKGVLGSAWRLGLMTAEEHARAVDFKRATGSRVPAGREVEHGEVKALFRACAADVSPAGRRDAALLGLLAGGGLRRAEVAGLQLSDYDATTGVLTVLGKGNKQRLCHTTNGSRTALDAWLAARGAAPGPLFCPVSQIGVVKIAPITAQVVRNVLVKRAEQASVGDCSPHDFRRTFIGNLLDAGADLATVQAMVGHANPGTTSKYDRRGENAKKRAAELVSVPYVAPRVTAPVVAPSTQAVEVSTAVTVTAVEVSTAEVPPKDFGETASDSADVVLTHVAAPASATASLLSLIRATVAAQLAAGDLEIVDVPKLARLAGRDIRDELLRLSTAGVIDLFVWSGVGVCVGALSDEDRALCPMTWEAVPQPLARVKIKKK